MALPVLVVGAGILFVFYEIAKSLSPRGRDETCGLDSRHAETLGTHSVAIRDRSLPGARLVRFLRNSRPEYAEVYACTPTEELLEPTEVFELTPHGGSAEDLANQYLWAFKDGGYAHVELVKNADSFVTNTGARVSLAAPSLRSGVVSFWHRDTWDAWGPDPHRNQVVMDARTGLGGESTLTAADPPRSRASLVEALVGPMARVCRGSAFLALAAAPWPDLLPELLTALEAAGADEFPYVGLLATRGMPFADGGERLARLADGSAGTDIRMGVVQALATLSGPRPRELASSILQREADPRARRIMTAALCDQGSP